MRVSFSGNIHLKPNTYSIKNQKGEEILSSNGVNSDIEINTDKVAYVGHQPNSETTELHMINGDIITANPPFNMNIYNIAQQLGSSQTVDYDSQGKISIYDNSIDKLREALNASGLFNTGAATVDNIPQETDKIQKEEQHVAEVQPAQENTNNISETQEDKPAGLKTTYNLNGIDYDVVGMNGFSSLEDFQKYILSKGMTNRGLTGNSWPGQCHNFSCEYGNIMLGSSKIDINSDFAAAQAAKGRDRQFQNAFCATNDTALQLMRAELESGRPCVVKINKPGVIQNHYGLVCGIRKDADRNNLKNTDFLFIDSYDGKIGQLNGKNYRELTGWKNAVHIWQGKYYNFSYAVKNAYAEKLNSPDQVKAAEIKRNEFLA